jgi:hypothetical protein
MEETERKGKSCFTLKQNQVATLRASAEFKHNGYETKYEGMKITEDMITKNHILCKLW